MEPTDIKRQTTSKDAQGEEHPVNNLKAPTHRSGLCEAELRVELDPFEAIFVNAGIVHQKRHHEAHLVGRMFARLDGWFDDDWFGEFSEIRCLVSQQTTTVECECIVEAKRYELWRMLEFPAGQDPVGCLSANSVESCRIESTLIAIRRCDFIRRVLTLPTSARPAQRCRSHSETNITQGILFNDVHKFHVSVIRARLSVQCYSLSWWK